MQHELWKDIPGYFGMYQVSNLGNIRSFKRSSPLVMKKQRKGGNKGTEYETVLLRTKGGYKSHYVHRLVAKAFVQNPKGDAYVDHIDRNPFNNRWDNLQWISHAHNIRRSQGFTYTLMNKETGEIVKYNSKEEVAQFLGLTKPKVYYRIKNNPHKPIKDAWFINVERVATASGGYL